MTEPRSSSERLRYLDPDGKPLTMEEWSQLFEKRHVGEDDSWWRKQTDVGDAQVSTVWLGLNHSFLDGPPLYWETMIFGGDHDESQWRHSSKEDALAVHDRIVADLQQGCNPNV